MINNILMKRINNIFDENFGYGDNVPNIYISENSFTVKNGKNTNSFTIEMEYKNLEDLFLKLQYNLNALDLYFYSDISLEKSLESIEKLSKEYL